MKDKARWKILLYTVYGLFLLQVTCNSIMASRLEMPSQPAFGMLCGTETLTLLIASVVVYLMPKEGDEQGIKKKRRLAIIWNVLLDIGSITIFILQIITGKYYPT